MISGYSVCLILYDLTMVDTGVSVIPANPSTFSGIFPHLNHVFNHLKILRNHKFYRICIDSHQMDVKSLNKGKLSLSDLWTLVSYTIANGACLSETERD